MNKVILIGRLVADPELKNLESGLAVARYRLAVDRKYKKDNERQADFINCVTFGKSAEFVERYLHKGTKIAVTGRLHTGSYEKDGQTHYTTDVIVEEHEFCESRQQSNNANSTASDPLDFQGFDEVNVVDVDDDLPF